MNQVDFTYEDMADYAAEWIFTNCNNVSNNYNNLPSYVKADYNQTITFPRDKEHSPSDPVNYIYMGEPTPTVKWTIVNDSAIPNKSSCTKADIKDRILVFTGTKLKLQVKPEADQIIGYLYKLVEFCIYHLSFYRQVFDTGSQAPTLRPGTYLAYTSTTKTCSKLFNSNDIIYAETVNDTFINLINIIKNNILIHTIRYKLSN